MTQIVEKQANKLIYEKSPYLLQHAHNPVNWYPWSEEAFQKAEKEDKPIFLSIGYSTCHWCHVMERESFEDEEVAQALNDFFVSIKVDREERPDIDSIYMNVCQALTGRGGWPLTIIMTPDKKPFFAGTYFPKSSIRGRMGLLQVLERIEEGWDNNRERVIKSSNEIVQVIQDEENQRIDEISSKEMAEAVDKTAEMFSDYFDRKYGGFGTAPKFPTPHNLMFLLRYWKLREDDSALEIVEETLDKMYRGGVYDHIGYGFSRYSTDDKWLVPHFEKMLYDNALLAITYLEAFQARGEEEYAEIAEEILTYVIRDMTSEQGGFYSAEDADSEGIEGKFYLWTPQEVKDVLGEDLGTEFCEYYDIATKGNFEGKSIPNLIGDNERKAKLEERFGEAKQKLFEARAKRVHPYKDDKILTSWNALMIVAMARAAKSLNKDIYLEQAEKAIDFIWNNLRNEDGRLLARYRDGDAAYLAYVDDYAFLVWALIELYESNFNAKYLKMALELNDDLIRYFWDDKQGGLYFYGSDGEELITRPKEVYDGAIPSGNSVATFNFLRLARLLNDNDLQEKADLQIKAFWNQIKEDNIYYSYFMSSLLFVLAEGREVIIVGNREANETKEIRDALRDNFTPFTTTLLKDERNSELLSEIAPFIENYQQIDDKVTAYICQNYTCQSPTTDLDEIRERLM